MTQRCMVYRSFVKWDFRYYGHEEHECVKVRQIPFVVTCPLIPIPTVLRLLLLAHWRKRSGPLTSHFRGLSPFGLFFPVLFSCTVYSNYSPGLADALGQ